MKFFQSVNWPITVAIFLLLSIGVLVISSSSMTLGLQQALFAILGIFIYIIISQLDYRTLVNLIKPMYFLTILLLVFVSILGFETRGSVRWIPLGFINIQPSEFAKPVMILFLAYFWSQRKVTW